MDVKDLKIIHAEKLCDHFSADAVIVIAVKGETVNAVSYGRTKHICRKTGKTLDRIVGDLTMEDFQ
jgi:hypothetical protein